jgi:apolipoprotein N-acyltransferase
LRWILIAASFLIVAFGQPAFVPELGLVAAVCGFALFWLGVRAFKGAPTRFLIAALWFCGAHMIQLSWMTVDELHGIYIWATWGLLCGLMGLEFGVLTLLVPKKGEYGLLRVLLIPAAWTVFEWGRLYILSGYTWNPVGLALTGADLPRQFASVVGIYGLSFWVMLANVLLLWALDGRLRIRRWAVAALVVAIPYLFGFAQVTVHGSRLAAAPCSQVLLVQPSIRPDERQPLGRRQPLHPLEQWWRLMTLAATYQGQPIDLVVFPEGSVPYDSDALIYTRENAQRFIQAALHTHSPSSAAAVGNAFFCQAISNALDCDAVFGLDHHNHNAAVLFSPQCIAPADYYGKRVLLPFAEYLPGEWTRGFAARYGITGSYDPGPTVKVFDICVPCGITVCYEEMFGQLIRENRQAGAEMLVNITNDGWYPGSRLPQQHFHHGRLRAVELGVPLVRSCTTGVTAAVDSLGRTIDQLDDKHSGALLVEVPQYHHRTLYASVGDGLPLGASFLIVLLALRQRTLRRRPR